MKKWIFYAVIFTVVSFAFPLLSGDGAKAGSALVYGLGVTFLVIVLYLIQLGWTKFFGIFKPKLVHQQDAAFASPISVRLEPMSQPVPPTQFPTPSPIQKTRDVAIQSTGDANQHQAHAQPSPSNYVDMDDDAIYTIVAEELESGKTDKGLWTRLYAESGGDEKQTKVLYITRRVEKLMANEKARRQSLQNQEAERIQQEALTAAERIKEEAAEAAEDARRKEAGIADPRLVVAVRNGNWAIVRQFLDDGVSPFDTNDEGVSLLELAKIRGDMTCPP